MKKYFFALVISLCFISIACEKDDNSEKRKVFTGELSFENKFFPLDVCHIYELGKSDSLTYLAQLQITTGFTFFRDSAGVIDSVAGRGSGITFDVYTKDSTGIRQGAYNKNDVLIAGSPWTVDSISVVYDFNVEEPDSLYEVTLRTCRLDVEKVNANYYNFTIKGIDTKGLPVRGTYSGPVELIDLD